MSLLQQALESGKFGVTAEMAPPKGCDFSKQMEDAECKALCQCKQPVLFHELQDMGCRIR